MTVRTQDDAEAPSKQSTLYLGIDNPGGSWAVLSKDMSQQENDAADQTTFMDMTSPASDLFDISDPRTIGAHAELDNTDTGEFFCRGTAGTTLLLEIRVAGTIRAVNNNAQVATLAIPGVSGTDKEFIFAWASRPNPLTTGASDAVQSWLYAINVDDGLVDRVEFTHAVMTTSATTATWGTAFTGPAIYGVWFENRCQSMTEVAQDWGATSPSAPSTVCDAELPPLPLDVASGVGDADELHGPVPQWAAKHNEHAVRRHWSPLVNARYLAWAAIRNDSAPGDRAYRLAPGSTDYYMAWGWLAAGPVPLGVTHAWVRMHVQSWVISGAAVPMGLRIYSMSRLPDDDGEPLEFYQVGERVTRDDTASGTGSWDIEDEVKLAIGADGWTYFCAAYAFDPLDQSVNDTNARIAVRAMHAVPCVVVTPGAP